MLKNFIAKASNKCGLSRLYVSLRKSLYPSQIAILTYHRINPENPFSNRIILDPTIFETHIQYFVKHFSIISLETLVGYLQNNTPLPKKAIIITFDDGYRDIYLYAFPILKKYSIPATVFLPTGYIETGKLFWWDIIPYVIHATEKKILNLGEWGRHSLETEKEKIIACQTIIDIIKGYPEGQKETLIGKVVAECGVFIPESFGDQMLSWNEIREMYRYDISFGAHTVHHTILTTTSEKDAEQEIVESKKKIEEKLLSPVHSFAYPNGDFNNTIMQLVKKSGFSCGVSRFYRLIGPHDNLFCLNRIDANQDLDMLVFILTGFIGDLGSTWIGKHLFK